MQKVLDGGGPLVATDGTLQRPESRTAGVRSRGNDRPMKGVAASMRSSSRDSAGIAANAGRSRARRMLGARALILAGILSAAAAISASPAMALTASHNVALIPSNQPSPAEGHNGQDGILPISSTVAGNANESFAKFSFTNVALSQITPTELAKFDTVVLNEVRVTQLTSAAKTALSLFVSGGGKLLIHDADETQ